MDLLKRYLHAVKFWLPANQQDDIVAELSEDLRSAAEDREVRLGHALTNEDWQDILRERGNPLLVANHYLPQQTLIGPVLFPVYRLVMKMILAICLLPGLAGLALMLVFSPAYRAEHFGPPLLFTLWGSVVLPAILSTFLVTLGFALLERYHLQEFEKWDPAKLPAVRDTRRIPRVATIFETAINFLFFLWAMQVVGEAALLERPGLRIAFTNGGRIVLLGLAVLALTLSAAGVVKLARPYWTPTLRWFQAGTHAMAAILFAIGLAMRPMLVVNSGPFLDELLASILAAAIVISVALAVVEARRALRRTSARPLFTDAATLVV